MKEFWDERYSVEKFVYGTEPNDFFSNQIEGVSPGRMLLPGEGEGRNAIYAAKLGWKVHAFDFSPKAREKATKLAKNTGVEIGYDILDAENFTAGEARYDAIGVFFIHFLPAQRRSFHSELVKSLAPGGMLIMEVFSKKQIENDSGGPKNIDMLYAVEDLTADMGGLDIVIAKEMNVEMSSGDFHNGRGEVIRLLAKKK